MTELIADRLNHLHPREKFVNKQFPEERRKECFQVGRFVGSAMGCAKEDDCSYIILDTNITGIVVSVDNYLLFQSYLADNCQYLFGNQASHTVSHKDCESLHG
jgi:hypothetical protein